MKFQWKLLAFFLPVGLASILLFYFLSQRQLEDFYLHLTQEHLANQARMLAPLIDLSNLKLDSQVDQMSRGLPYRITVLNGEGRVVADSSFSGNALSSMENHLTRPEVQQAQNQGVGVSTRFSASIDRWLLYVAVPLPSRAGFLRLALPLAQVQEVFSGLRNSLVVIAAALVLFALIAGLLISHHITTPVVYLTRAAQHYSAGELNHTIQYQSRDELGELAETMQTMAHRLNKQMKNLESERNRLKTILSSMVEGVLVTDARGCIVESNPSLHRLLELEPDVRHHTPLEVVRSAEIQRGIEKVLISGKIYDEEVQIRDRMLLVRFAPLSDQKTVTGVVAVFHDVTQLRRLENLRKEFVSNVSHELKTPLTSIQGFAETLLEDISPQTTKHSFVQKILHNAQRLSSLIEDLLHLSRLESGAAKLQKSLLSFSSIMDDLRKEFTAELNRKGIRFIVRNLGEDDLFPASEAYIRSVFHNLIENAVKYTETGEIKVSMQSDDDKDLAPHFRTSLRANFG